MLVVTFATHRRHGLALHHHSEGLLPDRGHRLHLRHRPRARRTSRSRRWSSGSARSPRSSAPTRRSTTSIRPSAPAGRTRPPTIGRMFVALKPKKERERNFDRRHPAPAPHRQCRSRHGRVFPECPEHQHRPAASPRASTNTRCNRATPIRSYRRRAEIARQDRRARGAARRHHRSLHQESADDGRDRPRKGGGLRHHHRSDPPGAVQRLRHAPGRDHLHADQRLSGHPGEPSPSSRPTRRSCRTSSSRPTCPARAAPAPGPAPASAEVGIPSGPSIPLSAVTRLVSDGRAAAGQPPGPAAGGDDLVQPRARLFARPGGRRHPADRARHRACRRRSRTGFQGTAQVFQDSLKGQGILVLAAIFAAYVVLGILYESFIHPITIISGLPSAGIGALLVADAVQDGPVGDRHDRHRHAGRHREEERHHDDRLRDRAPARRARAPRRRSARRRCCASGRS